VSNDERIAVLEALLARIRSRSKEPRDTRALVHDVAPPAAEAESREPTMRERALEERITVTPPPTRAPEPSQVRPIEPPPMEVIELDLEPDPTIPPPSMEPSSRELESRSRLVSAPPVTLEDEEVHAMPTAAASGPVNLAGPDADIDEPAPSSSRRPISVEEKLKQLAEDDDAVHVPPPESGKVPAAPIINLDEPDVTPPLRPETARATLPDAAEVASFIGDTPRGEAVTFGALLDATLAL
jgi:hypothetical protein